MKDLLPDTVVEDPSSQEQGQDNAIQSPEVRKRLGFFLRKNVNVSENLFLDKRSSKYFLGWIPGIFWKSITNWIPWLTLLIKMNWFQTGQLAPLIREFELGEEAIQAATAGDLGAFLKALQVKAQFQPSSALK